MGALMVTKTENAAFKEQMQKLADADTNDGFTMSRVRFEIYEKSAQVLFDILEGKRKFNFRKVKTSPKNEVPVLFTLASILGHVKLPLVTAKLKELFIKSVESDNEIFAPWYASVLEHHIGNKEFRKIIRPYMKNKSGGPGVMMDEIIEVAYPEYLQKQKRKKPDVGDLQPPKKFRASPAPGPAEKSKVKLPQKG
jgi:hypothetical protein